MSQALAEFKKQARLVIFLAFFCGIAATTAYGGLTKFFATASRTQPVRQDAYVEGVRPLAHGTTPTDYRTIAAVANIDSGTEIEFETSTAESIFCGGYLDFAVSGKFSTASATATCVIARYHANGSTLTYLSSEEFTLTADSITTDEGDYTAQLSFSDSTRGAHVLKVLVTSLSAGSLDVVVEVW
jgi:hypothetical protein